MLNWRPNGYLFIAGPRDVETLAANFGTQQRHGVQAQWLESAQLADRYPAMRTDDLAGAVLSVRDGWLDPAAFFAGVRAPRPDGWARCWSPTVWPTSVQQGRWSARQSWNPAVP